jgi:hypothetical protein
VAILLMDVDIDVRPSGCEQPVYKNAAVTVQRRAAGEGPGPARPPRNPRPALTGRVPVTIGGPAAQASESIDSMPAPSVASRKESVVVKFPAYLGMQHRGEQTLAAAFRQ